MRRASRRGFIHRMIGPHFPPLRCHFAAHRMSVYQLDQHTPRIAPSAWVADSAEVIGRVTLHDDTSVWYHAVLRGDTDDITIGRRSNVQDAAVLHADPGFPLTVGEGVTIGHQAMLHGCSVGDGSLIGIQAVVLNGARIGRDCLVGAGALVTEGKEFPDGSMILGAPAKLVRALRPDEIAGLQRSAARYVENARRHRSGLKKLSDE
jgi:carbonic anhydrase/acetyltransferase-like protein (isoleucine patch superfamily)